MIKTTQNFVEVSFTIRSIKIILPILSKIFEKCMFEQMSQCFENIFAKYQCGFRKGFSTQQYLLAILEKWKRSVDNSKMFGGFLTDLPKDLLIASTMNCSQQN